MYLTRKLHVSSLNADTGAVVWSTELAPDIKEKFRIRDSVTQNIAV